jgi:hypothetical protein
LPVQIQEKLKKTPVQELQNAQAGGYLSRVARKCTKNGREKCTTLASWFIHIDNLLFDFFFKPKTFSPNINNHTMVEQTI